MLPALREGILDGGAGSKNQACQGEGGGEGDSWSGDFPAVTREVASVGLSPNSSCLGAAGPQQDFHIIVYDAGERLWVWVCAQACSGEELSQYSRPY